MIDNIIINLDKILSTLFLTPQSQRSHPDVFLENLEIEGEDKKNSIGLMRINHCGEICAQALYLGQQLTSRNKDNKEVFIQAAAEEEDHLAWTSNRLKELNAKPSKLIYFFYFNSLCIGIIAGIAGDKWNLAFLEATELQVCEHLGKHLLMLSNNDIKSKAIIKQMIIDEKKHAISAKNEGATELPQVIKNIMSYFSKVMTTTTYYL